MPPRYSELCEAAFDISGVVKLKILENINPGLIVGI
jgi:hypothetical protein